MSRMRKRRPKGEGQVWERRPGVFVVRQSGFKAQTVHGTREDAVAVLAQMTADLKKKALPKPAPDTLADFMQRWLARQSVDPKTRANYAQHIKGLTDALGSTRVQNLTTQQIEDYIRLWSKSSTTLSDRIGLLRRILNAATMTKWGPLLRSNPMDEVEAQDRPTRDTQAAPYLDAEQARLFLAEVKRSPHTRDRYPLYLTAILTGMRQGEVLGMAWDHVNLDLGYVEVAQSLQRVNGVVRLKEPKTNRRTQVNYSLRTVPLLPVVVEALRSVRVQQAKYRMAAGAVCDLGAECRERTCPKWHDLGLVFTQPNGKPVHAHNLTQRNMKGALKRAGLNPKVRFHSLRHTTASLLDSMGASKTEIRAILGHSREDVTDTYLHAGLERARHALEQVGDVLGMGR